MIKLLVLSGLLLQQPTFPTEIPKLTEQPKPHIFVVGESEHEKEQWLNGQGTAYYNGRDRMNGESGITASGYNLNNGIYFKGYRVVAGSKDTPLGTTVEIKLHSGELIKGVVLDYGGAITQNKFDILYRTKAECFNFGRQAIQYKVTGRIGYK